MQFLALLNTDIVKSDFNRRKIRTVITYRIKKTLSKYDRLVVGSMVCIRCPFKF